MTKTFELCVKEHVKRYPKAQPQDLYKLCFQAAFGAEHLLQDEERAWQYLQREYENVLTTLGESETEQPPMYEWIAPEVVRVNLAVYKEKGLSLENLFRVFVDSAKDYKGDVDKLEFCLKTVAQIVASGRTNFTLEEWTMFCAGREIAPVHHSQIYRDAYRPSYRVVAGRHIASLELGA